MSMLTKFDNPLKGSFAFLEHVKYEHLLAGMCGGLASTLLLHPLDVIKIRFAVNDGRLAKTPKYNGILDAFRTIYRQEGVYGLYRGITPNLWGAGSSWGLYFLFYNSIKSFVQGNNLQVPLRPDQHLLAATQAGAMTLVVTNPLWVVKTRLCLQHQGSAVYKGMIDALICIYRIEGVQGYYRGFLPGLFGVSHGAVQFMVYEELKNRYNKHHGTVITTKLSTFEYLTFAAISKLIATATTYPYQVVRARLQNQQLVYKGVFHCIKETWKFEGWRGFYKGLGTNLLRVTPATMITFVVYENISHALMKPN